MPNTYLFTGKDGVTRKFIGDAPPTDDEQAAIEGAAQQHPMPAAPKSFTQWLTDKVGPRMTGDALPIAKGFSPQIQSMATTPLVHPTGFDPIDKMIASPVGVAMLAAGAGGGLAESPGGRSIVGRGLQAVGDFDFVHPFKSTVGAVGDALVRSSSAPAGGALSAADRALLAKQGYSPESIQRAEQAAQQQQPPRPAAAVQSGPSAPVRPAAPSAINSLTGETPDAWRARMQSKINTATAPPLAPAAPMPARPPVTISPSSPMQPPAVGAKAATLAGSNSGADALGSVLDAIHGPDTPLPGNGTMRPPMRSIEGSPVPLYPSTGTVKGVTSNNLEAASNAALAAGHWDEAERLIGQSLQSFFQGSGTPMVGILAAAIAHKARQAIEPLRANPAFQQAPPAKQQQMIQQALRQPNARGALTSLLGS